MVQVVEWSQIILIALTVLFILLVLCGAIYTGYVWLKKYLSRKRREKFLRDYQEQQFNIRRKNHDR